MFLHEVVFSGILICSTLAAVSPLACSPEYCNFAGECKVVNKKPRCSCYEEAFQGEYCERVKNLCETSQKLCPGNQLCVPYVGQAVCVCPPQIRSADCRLERLLCSYNVRALYGAEEPFVLSFAELSDEPVQITISTPTYLLAHVLLSKQINSRRTENLTGTLQDLGIRRHINLPYNAAYYYVFKARHYTLGANPLTVTVARALKGRRDIGHSQPTLSLLVHVVRRKNVSCLATVTFPNCMDPSKPRQVDVERFTNLQATVERRCNSSAGSFMRTKWSIRGTFEQHVFIGTEVGDQLLFKIPRFTLWHESLLKFYPDLLITVLLSAKENDSTWASTRCYLNVTARNVVAHIAGGHYREIGEGSRWVLLNGSQSREPASHPRGLQHLKYTWTLSSDNGLHKEYLSVDSSNPTLMLPLRSLSRDHQNVITLRVYNKFAKARSASSSQVIVVARGKHVRNVNIECIRNCERNLYVASQSFHLRAACPACRTPTSYTWTLNGVDLLQDKSRLVTQWNASVGSEVNVGLRVVDSGGSGRTEMRLRPVQPPRGGQCRIRPQYGRECVTKFHVSCESFYSGHQEPILYIFKTGSFYEDILNSGATSLHLNRNAPLTVEICGYHLACTELSLPVTLEGSAPTDTDTEKVSNLLEDGRRQEAFCVLQIGSVASKRMDNIARLEVPLADDSFPLIEMVNSIGIACNYMSRLQSFEDLSAVSGLLSILDRAVLAFDSVVRDTEILDLARGTCLDLGKRLTDMIMHCMNPDVEILRLNAFLWERDDEIHDSHEPWKGLQYNIVLRQKQIMAIIKRIFQLWRSTGNQLSRYISPEEPLNYVLTNISYRAEMLGADGPAEHSSTLGSCFIRLPLQTVESLRDILGTNYLLLHTWCFSSPIFWWVPATSLPTTATMAVDVFGRNSVNPQQSSAASSQSTTYTLGLRHLSNNGATYFLEDSNVVHNEVMIYRLNLQSRVNLLVNFLRSEGVRVMLTWDVKPTLQTLYNRSGYVPKGCRNKMIVLKNRCTKERTAFVAVYKADSRYQRPVHYTLRISAQEFDAINLQEDSPMWKQLGCSPTTRERNPEFSECTVNHLSIFSAKEYKIHSLLYHYDPNSMQRLPYNFVAIFCYCLVGLGSLSILLLALLRDRARQRNLIRVIRRQDDEEKPSTENVIVHLRTAGSIHSSTTANVKLIFASTLGRYKVVIYQNPLRPQLEVNTSCLLRLSDRRVQLPCRLTISHDMSGRYPSWYCRSIQVDDLRRDLSYTFPIYSWIRGGEQLTVSCLPTETTAPMSRGHYIALGSKYSRVLRKFRYYCKFYFANWFMMQPILGPWRFSDESLNAFERTCIWLCRTIITVTTVLCYCRTTTLANYTQYPHLDIMPISDLLAVAFGSYAVVLAFEFCVGQLTPLGLI